MKIDLSTYTNNTILSYIKGVSTLKNDDSHFKKYKEKNKKKQKKFMDIYSPDGQINEESIGLLFDQKA